MLPYLDVGYSTAAAGSFFQNGIKNTPSHGSDVDQTAGLRWTSNPHSGQVVTPVIDHFECFLAQCLFQGGQHALNSTIFHTASLQAF